MIKILVEDEDLYDISLDKRLSFPKFIGAFLHEMFWRNKEGILKVTELIIDPLIERKHRQGDRHFDQSG